jgi:VanZ family protein
MKKSIWASILTMLWTISVCAVCYYSLMPELELPIDFWNADKIYHLIAYAWLAFLPMLRFRTRKAALLASCFMLILGIFLEIAQTHVPGRTFSFLDMTVNGLGVLAGVVLGGWVKPKFNILLHLEGDED